MQINEKPMKIYENYFFLEIRSEICGPGPKKGNVTPLQTPLPSPPRGLPFKPKKIKSQSGLIDLG